LEILKPAQSKVTLDAVIFMHAVPERGEALFGAPARLVLRIYVSGLERTRQEETLVSGEAKAKLGMNAKTRSTRTVDFKCWAGEDEEPRWLELSMYFVLDDRF
jgi:hypothetical protein